MALSRASSPSKIWWKKSSEKSEKMTVCPPLTPFANPTAAWSFAAAFRSKKCRSCSAWNGTLPARNPLPPSPACSITSPAMSLRRENTWTTAACALKSWKPTSEKSCVSASAEFPPRFRQTDLLSEFSAAIVLNAFRNLTQRTLRKATEATEGLVEKGRDRPREEQCRLLCGPLCFFVSSVLNAFLPAKLKPIFQQVFLGGTIS